MKKSAFLALIAAITMSGCTTNQGAMKQEDTIKVSKVVMYQSGVGYVERVGQVNGDSIALSIRSDQINDILKSLTVIDRSDGRPVSISLPVDRGSLKTAEVPEGGLLELFKSFRGAHVTVKTRGRFTTTGRIVGVEKLLITKEEDVVPKWKLTVVDASDVLHAFDYEDIESVSLLDHSLSDGLSRSLDVSLNDGDWKQVDINIQLDGDRKRDVALSYIVAMPTWKPAYRLVLGDDGKSVLQGWAVISNVSGSDWEDIDFSLVSGQPMSFTYDLYTPQYLDRPDLTSRGQQRAIAPKVTKSGYSNKIVRAMLDGGVEDEKAYEEAVMPTAAAAAESYDRGMTTVGIGAKSASKAAKTNMAKRIVETPVESVVTQDYGAAVAMDQVGSFDTYTLESKLTVKDSSTALVNLLQHNLPAKEVRLFDVSGSGEQNESWQTIQLKNDSNLALEPGPITIYHGSTFVGEGYLSRTAPGATAQLTFAAESRVSLSQRSTDSKEDYVVKSVSGGRIQYEYDQMKTYTFDATNHAGEDLTVMAQIPRLGCYEPVDMPDDAVKNDASISYPIDVKARDKKQAEFKTKCRKQGSVSISAELAVEALENTLKVGKIPTDMVESVKEFVRLSKETRDLNESKWGKQSIKSSLESDQNEITSSLHDLKNVKSSSAEKLKNQLIARQTANEKQIAQLATEITEMQIRISENEIAMKELTRLIKF